MKKTRIPIMLFVSIMLMGTATGQPLNIPAKIDVSTLGTATYTIPIEVVPGTNGMQPNLSIVYNSVAGEGNIGSKWSLQGISSITRAPQSIVYDGNITAVDFSTNDGYALDGCRMLLNSRTDYHADNAVYAFEFADFSSIKKINDGNDCYFVHRLENDGRIEYGSDAQSRFVLSSGECLSWLVSKAIDMDGNYMVYSYGQDNNEIWIDHIDYTFLSGTTSAFARVEFTYTTMTAPNDSYISGRAIRQSKLLKNINIYYQNNLVRRYNFIYTNDGQYDRLTTIKLFDGANSLLSSTSITWDTSPNEIASLGAFDLFDHEYYVTAGNFNDDRIQDIFAVRKTDLSAFVVLGSADGQFSDMINLHYTIPVTSGDRFSFRACDIDGDGIDEIAFVQKGAIPLPPTLLYETVFYNVDLSDNTLQSNYQGLVTQSDIFFSRVSGKIHGETGFLAPNNHTLNFRDIIEDTQLSYSYNSNGKIVLGDFNGDGRTDVMEVTNHGASAYIYNLSTAHWDRIINADFPKKNFHIQTGDFNGDGTADLLTYDRPNRKWQLSFYSADQEWIHTLIALLDATPEGNDSDDPQYIPLVYDINGDGKSDILQYVGEGQLNYIISQGCHNGQYIIQSSGTISCPTWIDLKNNRFATGDFDGNGIADFLFINPDGEGTDFAKILYFNQRSLSNRLVKTITDKGQKTIKLEYNNISLMPNHYKGYGMNWVPFPLVKKVCISTGYNNYLDTTQYYYGNAVFDTTRRQFIGFGLFGAKHGKQYSESYFSNSNNTLPILMLDSAVSYVYTEPLDADIALYRSYPSPAVPAMDTMVVARVKNTNSLKSKNLIGGNIQYLLYTPSTLVLDYLKNTAVTQTTVLVERTWKTRSTTTEKGYIRSSQEIPFRETVLYTYSDILLPSNTVSPRVIKKTVNNYNDDSHTNARTQVTNYSYHHGKITVETVETNDGSVFTTNYVYNGNGTLRKKISCPQGEVIQSADYEYDPTYRFVTRKRDAQNRSSFYTYDYATGRCLSETGIDGLTTTYTYDNAGRMTSTIRPDGTAKTMTYHETSGGLPHTTTHTVINETGMPQRTEYFDCQGRLRYTYVPGTGYNQINYNSQGKITSQSIEPFNNVSQEIGITHKYRYFKYDVFGRLKIDSSLYSKTTYTYASAFYYSGQPYYYVCKHGDLGSVTTCYYDASGRVNRVVDDGGDIYYNYSRQTENGLVLDLTTIANGSNTTEILTDSRGNRLKLVDPDAGTTVSTYYGWNALVSQTDALGNVVTMEYNSIGLPISKTYSNTSTSETYTYQYNTTSASIDKPSQVKRDGAIYRTFHYDVLGRLDSETKYLFQEPFTHSYTYNSDGRLYTLTYPSGFRVQYEYDTDGLLKTIKNHATGDEIYSIAQRDLRTKQPKRCFFGNTTGVEYTYDALGLTTSIKYGNVTEVHELPIFPMEIVGADEQIETPDNPNLDPVGPGIDTNIIAPITTTYAIGSDYSLLNYTYNDKAYITSKSDIRSEQQETYSYDILGRLVSYAVNNNPAYSFLYDNNGNIAQNDRLNGSQYYYDNTPHAVTQATIPDDMVSDNPCTVTYNNRNRPQTITEGDWSLSLAYDDGLQCEKDFLYHNNQLVEQTLFVSKISKVKIKNNNLRYIDYINDENGHTVALHVHNNAANADSLYYVQTDLLGSWERIVDEDRNVVQSCHFDPWGNRMKADDWATSLDGTELSFHRGFTGHEHYDRFRIINMNARLYDPVIGRFFSPDPLVTNPYSTQGFNRYSYCGNNPVMYTDPDGEFGLLAAALIGAVLVGGVNLGIHISQGDVDNFWDGLGYFAQGALAGGIIGATWYGGISLLASGSGWGWVFAGVKILDFTTTAVSMIQNPTNATRIFFGRYYFDENMLHGFSQALMRYTTEALQTWVGYNFTQLRNVTGCIDRVDYLGGATFATYENNGTINNRHPHGESWGATLGSFINMSIPKTINGPFLEYVLNHQLFMHEYGHTIQSQILGASYLFTIGIPSLISIYNDKEIENDPYGASTHDYFFSETWANRLASWYFKRNYNYEWKEYGYPFYDYR